MTSTQASIIALEPEPETRLFGKPDFLDKKGMLSGLFSSGQVAGGGSRFVRLLEDKFSPIARCFLPIDKKHGVCRGARRACKRKSGGGGRVSNCPIALAAIRPVRKCL